MTHEARLKAAREVGAYELFVQRNVELCQAKRNLSKVNQDVVVQMRSREGLAKQLRDTEVSQFDLNQDLLAKETKGKRLRPNFGTGSDSY